MMNGAGGEYLFAPFFQRSAVYITKRKNGISAFSVVTYMVEHSGIEPLTSTLPVKIIQFVKTNQSQKPLNIKGFSCLHPGNPKRNTHYSRKSNTTNKCYKSQ
ncbi:hypothetical protein P4V64_25040 [Bacillus thuringiensis]|nr:hypothetical protein [Bacillus thuringiensis]